jgi:prevent-host-death family protein
MVKRETNIWALQEAKSKLCDLVALAEDGEPQIITRHGKRTVVVIDHDTYAKMRQRPKSLGEALEPGPVYDNEIVDQLFSRTPFSDRRSKLDRE